MAEFLEQWRLLEPVQRFNISFMAGFAAYILLQVIGILKRLVRPAPLPEAITYIPERCHSLALTSIHHVPELKEGTSPSFVHSSPEQFVSVSLLFFVLKLLLKKRLLELKLLSQQFRLKSPLFPCKEGRGNPTKKRGQENP